jgi:hypothetical protein
MACIFTISSWTQVRPPKTYPPAETGRGSPAAMTISRFSELLNTVDWENADAEDARAVIEDGLSGTEWYLGDFSLYRYPTNTGMTPNAIGIVQTGSTCLRVSDVVSALGSPTSLTLPPPFGSLSISTPELVDRYINMRAILSVQYLPNRLHFHSFEFNPKTGCFDQFFVGRH